MATALMVIDVQMDFVTRREAGRDWGNPAADTKIAEMISAFRSKGLPVWHVHHHGIDVTDTMHADAPGAVVQPCAEPLAGEPVVIKSTSSAFVATGLEAKLRAAGIDALVVIGDAANFCVESSVRSAADLGFGVTVAEDALINLDSRLRDGRKLSAADVLAMSLANLDGEFARVLPSSAITAEL